MAGSWSKRGKDSYLLTVCIGTDFKGKPKRFTKTVHCNSDAKADRELAKFYAACEAGDITQPNKITVEAFCDLWIEKYANKKLKDRTTARYKIYMKHQIKPILGKKKLTSLKRLQVQEWVNYLSDEKDLSPKTVRGAFSLLHNMYNSAIKWEITNKNPCTLIDLPPLKKKEADYLRLEELQIVLSALDEIAEYELQHVTSIILTIFTGIRLGELTGLKWTDIDFDKAEMRLERQRAYIHELGVVEYDLKTDNSNRTVAIPNICIEYLQKLQTAQKEQRLFIGPNWTDSGYVLINEIGEPIYPRLPSKWFIDFVENLEGVHRITFHQLRHTHVALLAHLGINTHKISKKVGHADEVTTLRTYMHILETTEHEDANKLDEFHTKISTQK